MFSHGRLLLAVVLALPVSLDVSGQLPDREPLEPEKFVFLLQYVATDYEVAVQDGAVVNEFEYREMQDLSALLVDHFDDLRRLGASDEIRAGLLELQDRIRSLRPPVEIRSRGTELVERLLTELEIRSLPTEDPDPERGRALFGLNCAPCHGTAGRGDGPSSPGMEPAPASFHDPRMDFLTHHQIYGAITFGIQGTAMPTFHGALMSDDVWDITFFVMGIRDELPSDVAATEASVVGLAPGTAEVSAAVEALRDDPDPRVRRWAAWTLGRSGTISPTAVDELLAGLRDDDAPVRSYAADALGRFGATAAPRLTEAIATDPTVAPLAETALIAIGAAGIPEIVRLLEQGGAREQSSAVHILTEIGPAAEPAVPHLVAALERTTSRARGVKIAVALGKIGQGSVPPLLQRFERSNPALVRELAGRALGFVGPEAQDAVPALLDALGDPSGRIRFTAASSLGQIRSAAAVPILAEKLMNDTNRTVRMYSIEALGSIGPAANPAIPVLIGAFSREDDNLASRAARALAQIGVLSLPPLMEALNNPNSRTRGFAVHALGLLDVESARTAPRLVAMLSDEDGLVRDRATAALTGKGYEAVPYLSAALTDGSDWRARGHAALALGQMTPPSVDALSALMAALDDSNESVRELACWSLGMLGPHAVPATARLSVALGSADSEVRRMAAWALGNVGPAASSVEPALEALLTDPSAGVREEAEEALQKLHGTYVFPGTGAGAP